MQCELGSKPFSKHSNTYTHFAGSVGVRQVSATASSHPPKSMSCIDTTMFIVIRRNPRNGSAQMKLSKPSGWWRKKGLESLLKWLLKTLDVKNESTTMPKRLSRGIRRGAFPTCSIKWRNKIALLDVLQHKRISQLENSHKFSL